jgi:hypothetical protein
MVWGGLAAPKWAFMMKVSGNWGRSWELDREGKFFLEEGRRKEKQTWGFWAEELGAW